jgi:translation initiation factor IF-1
MLFSFRREVPDGVRVAHARFNQEAQRAQRVGDAAADDQSQPAGGDGLDHLPDRHQRQPPERDVQPARTQRVLQAVDHLGRDPGLLLTAFAISSRGLMRSHRAIRGGVRRGPRPGASHRFTQRHERQPMVKEELLEMQGKVEEVLPDSRFRVALDNDHALVSCSSGRVRRHHIRILAGDKVRLELSPYDLGKGRITSRHLKSRGGGAPRRA